MSKIKSIASTVYNYTHIFVGAGAVVTSFLDTQQLPPKFAAGVVIASQALKVAADALSGSKTLAPVAEKLVESAVAQIVHPAPAVVPVTPLEPATPAQPTGAPVQA
jgi:hypothetical protein